MEAGFGSPKSGTRCRPSNRRPQTAVVTRLTPVAVDLALNLSHVTSTNERNMRPRTRPTHGKCKAETATVTRDEGTPREDTDRETHEAVTGVSAQPHTKFTQTLIWVQCDTCSKWRSLPACRSETELPLTWCVVVPSYHLSLHLGASPELSVGVVTHPLHGSVGLVICLETGRRLRQHVVRSELLTWTSLLTCRPPTGTVPCTPTGHWPTAALLRNRLVLMSSRGRVESFRSSTVSVSDAIGRSSFQSPSFPRAPHVIGFLLPFLC